MITKLFIKEKIKSRIEENKDNLQLKVVNIWKTKNKVLEKVVLVNKELNIKYKEKGIKFFVDPSYEQWFAVSVPWYSNDIWASLRIKSDNNILDNRRNFNFFSDNIQIFLSFRSYDILHKEEYEYLKEAAEKYLEIKK
jgi:hypothetical protein